MMILFLLREILCENPFADCKKWACVMESINKVTGRGFSLRSVKESLALALALQEVRQ